MELEAVHYKSTVKLPNDVILQGAVFSFSDLMVYNVVIDMLL